MKRRHISVLSGVAAAAVALTMAPAQAQAIPVQGDREQKAANRAHDLPNPLGDAQRALRQEAINKLIKGQATTETRGGQRVITIKGSTKAKKGSKAAKDRYVSCPTNREEDIFTILADFGDQTMPTQRRHPRPGASTRSLLLTGTGTATPPTTTPRTGSRTSTGPTTRT